ncbi:hypothetical protein ACWFR5_19435 [Streptomyces sp. NPDC055092]
MGAADAVEPSGLALREIGLFTSPLLPGWHRLRTRLRRTKS